MNRKQRRAKGAQKQAPGKQQVIAALRQADALLAQGRFDDAAKMFANILRADPSNATALFNLGTLHHQRGRLKEAENCFRRILQTNPADADALMALAFVLLDGGDMDAARPLAVKAIEIAPTARLLSKAGILEREMGDLKAAEELFARAIDKDPADISAFYALCAARKFSADDKVLKDFLSRDLNSPALSLDDRIKLRFALGKACLDTGDADASFAHYAEGNRLKKSTYKVFTIEKLEQYIDSIIELFTEETVKKHKGAGHASARPVFIVGMPRSGSTLTDQILSSHPDVAGLGEVACFRQSVPAFRNTEVADYFSPGTPSITAGLMEQLSNEMLRGVAKKYLSLTDTFASDAPVLTDKMLFNYLWIGLIRLALPKAKIIHCTRDPADMGLSIWRLLFRENMPWAYDLAEIGRYYKAYRKLMAHWEKLFPGDILEVAYEDLVAKQEEQSRRLLAFCNLEWDDRCLSFHETERQVRTASAAQVRQPIYGDSVKRWKKYEKYLAPLLENLPETP